MQNSSSRPGEVQGGKFPKVCRLNKTLSSFCCTGLLKVEGYVNIMESDKEIKELQTSILNILLRNVSNGTLTRKRQVRLANQTQDQASLVPFPFILVPPHPHSPTPFYPPPCLLPHPTLPISGQSCLECQTALREVVRLSTNDPPQSTGPPYGTFMTPNTSGTRIPPVIKISVLSS